MASQAPYINEHGIHMNFLDCRVLRTTTDVTMRVGDIAYLEANSSTSINVNLHAEDGLSDTSKYLFWYYTLSTDSLVPGVCNYDDVIPLDKNNICIVIRIA